ncbi:zinc-binding dehydrogenase [Amycolatopsis sp. YIM 10]|uniref:zinc-binding dehydrogenase n=1 Tax=Amycolatopsis sp. YIM 10 TaxID=2653857 RepID=UPI00128FDAC1|nr:zinc-binding dehydrogenase [Amycolatopsis sp. YIM 10]QFU88763.1 Quinone oxidoreductase 1 [Amycolatopsis sp. YIM 10]
MRAIRQYEFGPAENLRYEEVEDPKPGHGQVRIRVRAAGVHLLDTSIRKGIGGGPMPLPTLPMTPGREVAGVVDELGPDADASWLGKRVVAHLGAASGGYAELAVAPVTALQEIPDGVTDEGAVATIGTGRTAMAVLNEAKITAGDAVLVTAAAGGIGSFAVQYAHNAGAFVIGLARGQEKLAIVRELGADLAFDYSEDNWADRVREALGDRELTVALDGVGGSQGEAALELLGVGGRLVMFGWSAGKPPELSAMDFYGRGLTVSVPIGQRMLRVPGAMRALEDQALAEVAAGRIMPLVNEPIPLAEVARAHTDLESRRTVGKVVLRP